MSIFVTRRDINIEMMTPWLFATRSTSYPFRVRVRVRVTVRVSLLATISTSYPATPSAQMSPIRGLVSLDNSPVASN